MKRTPRKKQMNELSCAYHEAGHAVADVHFEFGCSIVTITPRLEAGTLGHASCLDGDHYDSVLTEAGERELHINVARAKDVIVSVLAGYAAEIHYGALKIQARQGASRDFEKARQILKEMGKNTDLSPWIEGAGEFVRNKWTAIEMVAHDLMETKVLDGTEVEVILAVANGEPGAATDLARYRILAGKGPTSQFPFVIVSNHALKRSKSTVQPIHVDADPLFAAIHS